MDRRTDCPSSRPMNCAMSSGNPDVPLLPSRRVGDTGFLLPRPCIGVRSHFATQPPLFLPDPHGCRGRDGAKRSSQSSGDRGGRSDQRVANEENEASTTGTRSMTYPPPAQPWHQSEALMAPAVVMGSAEAMRSETMSS